MQPFGFLCASSPRFFIGYWILQRGWVSTRPLLLTPGLKGVFKKFISNFTIVSNFLVQIAIQVYIKDKCLI